MSGRRQDISHLWHQVNRRMHSLLNHAFRESAMPPPVFFMLREIVREPGITVSELARRVDMVKSHVSRTVDHLAREGYVRKEPDAGDQRLIRLYARPEAQDRLRRTDAAVRSVWESVVAGVPEEELATVERGLRILLETLERNAATRQREKV
ncbi:MAG: MarR family transcriptional regulator [Symbiobacterium sp.]|uniref:MarR family winged helix-turn-helix transcriptional regulator n=1 Tax=Symbiobacterium sp. TaxID=1971213 RepID=UPI003464195F